MSNITVLYKLSYLVNINQLKSRNSSEIKNMKFCYFYNSIIFFYPYKQLTYSIAYI